MSLHTFVLELITNAIALHPTLTPLVITLCTMFLEDTTTAIVGLLTATHRLPIETEALCLTLGIIGGDFLLYGVGRASHLFPSLKRWVHDPRLAGIEHWLNNHIFSTIFVTRFLPGFRLSIYVAYGFLGVPLRRFAPPAILAALTWTTLLFGIFYFFGKHAFAWLGVLQWPIIITALLLFYLAGHFHLKRFLAHAKKSSESAIEKII